MAKKAKNPPKQMEEKDKSKRDDILERTLSHIQKQYGPGSIMRLGDDIKIDLEHISSGSLSLDIALGIGGIPRGRVVEVYGPESSGKTTMALHAVAEAQKEGGVVAFIDAEHALDPGYAKKLGVKIDELLVSQPESGEQALEICEQLVRSNAVDLIVVDSVAALVPRSEIEGDMGDSQVGVQARLMSQALRKLTGIIHKSHATVIFINQIRLKIGVMFGNPETTPGGLALKFHSSVRIEVRRIGNLKDGEEIIGTRVRCKVVKNKVAPPFKNAEFDLIFNGGVSKLGEIIDLGVEYGIVNKTGAWFSYGDARLGQGRENSKKYLDEEPEMAQEIEHKIRVAAGLIHEDAPAEENDDEKETEE